MIFNKEFDKTLVLMLECDGNNKDIIMDFIREIPDFLEQQIKNSFLKFDKIREDSIYLLDMEDIEGEFTVNNKIKYYYIIDMVFNCLTIGKTYIIDGKDSKELEIKLYSDGNDNLSLGERYLGSLYRKKDNIFVDYELVNSIFGLMIVSKNRRLLNNYKKIGRKCYDCKKENDCKLVRVKKIK